MSQCKNILDRNGLLWQDISPYEPSRKSLDLEASFKTWYENNS